jgi:hypothetical protein
MSPSQNGSTASRSTRPAALSADLSLARAGERCRLGACSTATHSRARYSAEKTTSEIHSIAANHVPYCACSAGTDSSAADTRLTTMIRMSTRLNSRVRRVPSGACSSSS